MNTAHSAFHWPDHVIGKRESRRIREEHNALYNSHAELLAALQDIPLTCSHITPNEMPLACYCCKASAAIDKATKEASK